MTVLSANWARGPRFHLRGICVLPVVVGLLGSGLVRGQAYLSPALRYDVRLQIRPSDDVPLSLWAHVVQCNENVLCDFYCVEGSDLSSAWVHKLYGLRFVFDLGDASGFILETSRTWWHCPPSTWGRQLTPTEMEVFALLAEMLSASALSDEGDPEYDPAGYPGEEDNTGVDVSSDDRRMRIPTFDTALFLSPISAQPESPSLWLKGQLPLFPSGCTAAITRTARGAATLQSILKVDSSNDQIMARFFNLKRVSINARDFFTIGRAGEYQIDNPFARAQSWLTEYAQCLHNTRADTSSYSQLLSRCPDYECLRSLYGSSFALFLSDAILGCAYRAGLLGQARKAFKFQMALLASASSPESLVAHLQEYQKGCESWDSVCPDETEVRQILDTANCAWDDVEKASVMRVVGGNPRDRPRPTSQGYSPRVARFDTMYLRTSPKESAARYVGDLGRGSGRESRSDQIVGADPNELDRRNTAGAKPQKSMIDAVLSHFPNAGTDQFEFVRHCVADALSKAAVEPNAAQVKSICQEIEQFHTKWATHEDPVPFLDYVCTMQLMIYYYLTPPTLDDADRSRLTTQHHELLNVMAGLHARLTDFGVSEEVAQKVEPLLEKGQRDLEELLSSVWLRAPQLPMSDEKHQQLKAVLEAEIQRLGKQLSDDLQAAVVRWRQDFARRKRPLPEQLGEDLLHAQYVTSRQFVTFFYGMAVRKYLLTHTNELSKSGSLFPFFRPAAYSVRYRLDTGPLFSFRPITEYRFQGNSSLGADSDTVGAGKTRERETASSKPVKNVGGRLRRSVELSEVHPATGQGSGKDIWVRRARQLGLLLVSCTVFLLVSRALLRRKRRDIGGKPGQRSSDA